MSVFDTIEAVIWDLDGTLYPFHDKAGIHCNEAVARAAIALGADISFEDAVVLCDENWASGGDGITPFVDRFGLDYTAFHHEYHRQSVMEEIVGDLDPCPKTIQCFKDSSVRHGILTHSHRVWAERVLDQKGYRDFFPDHLIVPNEEVTHNRKDQSRVPFETMLDRLGCPPEKAVMVEDGPKYLKIPKETGMKTVLVTHGKMTDSYPWVDRIIHDPLTVLQTVNASRRAVFSATNPTQKIK